ncbi:hypothetical protein ABBQ32_009589 [Trebouxia sp. C0010 RCD-2024]
MYETLSALERAELVHSATQCVSAWLAKPLAAPQPQHNLEVPDQHSRAPPPLPFLQQQQQQLFERQQSGASASTSQSPDTLSPSHEAASQRHSTNGALHPSNSPAPDRAQMYSTSTELPPALSARLQGQSSNHTMGATQQHPLALNSWENQETSVSAVAAARQERPLDDVKVMGEEPKPLHDANILFSTDQHTALPSIPQSSNSPEGPIPSASGEFHEAHHDEDTTTSSLPLQHSSVHEDSSSTSDALENHSRSDSSQPEVDMSGSTEDKPEGKGQKAVKPETLAFQASFAQAAAVNQGESLSGADFAAAGQRTEVWHAMRQGRLTASSFANALGMFSGGRETLWAEKLGLVPRFAGNAATRWGTRQEEEALARYGEITGQMVEECGFKVLKDDGVHGWLGASPDGLLHPSGVPSSTPMAAMGSGAGVIHGEGPGVLEIKCPFNKGDPNSAAPPKLAQWYYMPQVQGLMDVFDRDWCNLFVWTVNGSMLFHIKRDPDYWRLCFQGLAEFWWSHVIPAKHELAANSADPVDHWRPHSQHAFTAQLIKMSKQMARDAPSTSFPPSSRRKS